MRPRELKRFTFVLCTAAVLLLSFGSNAVAFDRRTPVVIAVQKASPSVVNISTERIIVEQYSDPFSDFFEQFYGRTFEHRVRVHSLGSGVIFDESGLVVTNDHVVRRASTIRLKLYNGKEYDGELLSTDPSHDLAVIKIHGKHKFPAIPFGTSKDLMIGETVIAVGNPFGLESSVTTGVVSATNRTIEIPLGDERYLRYEGLLQTDALINPGNSGGALLNINGELIGINTAIMGEAQGIGFAIPVDTVRECLGELLDFPSMHGIWLGLRVKKTKEGMMISAIDKDSPADKAGLRPGDLILKVDGRKIVDLFDLQMCFRDKTPTDKITFNVKRNDKEQTIVVQLKKRPRTPPTQLLMKRLGITGQTLTERLARRLGLAVPYGVLVVQVRPMSPADKIGLEPKDVIVQIGRFRVRSVEDVAQILSHVRRGDTVRIAIVRKDSIYVADIEVQ